MVISIGIKWESEHANWMTKASLFCSPEGLTWSEMSNFHMKLKRSFLNHGDILPRWSGKGMFTHAIPCGPKHPKSPQTYCTVVVWGFHFPWRRSVPRKADKILTGNNLTIFSGAQEICERGEQRKKESENSEACKEKKAKISSIKERQKIKSSKLFSCMCGFYKKKLRLFPFFSSLWKCMHF